MRGTPFRVTFLISPRMATRGSGERPHFAAGPFRRPASYDVDSAFVTYSRPIRYYTAATSSALKGR